ncbi:MAG: hypothetical protein V4555_00185 [Acidobacteriota bacterium]
MKIAGGVMLLALAVVGCGKQPVESDVINEVAKVSATSPYAVMDWTPISTSVNRGEGTMATLFADESAVKHLRSGVAYGESDQIALVTWKQREDPHWFGARIPGEVVRVEIVTMGLAPTYGRFAGTPLVPEKTSDGDGGEKAILAMKPAWTP